MAKECPSRPVMGRVFMPSGPWARAWLSRAAGRMTAWGQTKEQRVHWMQFSGFHTGISVATALLSWALLPGGV